MLKRRLRVLPIVSAALLSVLSASVTAAERVALVVGNATYAHAPRLANPLNDAADIGAALQRLGFTVERLDNADKAEMEQALHKLSQAATRSQIAIVFYAGHGIEVDKQNFLVPVNARLASERDVEFETVPLELVIRAVDRAAVLGLVILDACRENPFVASMRRSQATRSIGRGLARVDPPGQTNGVVRGQGRPSGGGWRRTAQQSVCGGASGAPRNPWTGSRGPVPRGARCRAEIDGRQAGAVHVWVAVQGENIPDGEG